MIKIVNERIGTSKLFKIKYYQTAEKEIPSKLGQARVALESSVNVDKGRSYDEFDMLADAQKMLAALTYALNSMYQASEQTVKDNMDAKSKAILELVNTNVATKELHGINEFDIDPTSLSRVFDRQDKVAKILRDLLS